MATAKNIPTEVDYVIVGGGTAGLVLAARLSEDPSKTILVLEAGKDKTQDPRVQIPALWTSLMGSDVDWQYKTTAQATLGNRCIKAPQGKLLGGSSGINGQAFIAPSKAGIDAWSKLGATGWTWERLQPFYKKSYTLQLPDQATQEHIGLSWVDKENHGSSGPVKVSFPAVAQDPLSKAWVETFKSIGYGLTADPFSGESTGGYSTMASVDAETKTRSYAATGYGLPAMQRPGVHVVTEALVHKITFAPTPSEIGDVTATGVETMIQGELHRVIAKREVIVAAGALNTPKLLELSGIGNSSILHQFNIPVVVDNPNVGENLQDHLMTGISFEVAEGVHTGDPLMRQEPMALQAAMQLYTEHQAGPMASGGVQSGAYMPVCDYGAQKDQESMATYMDRFLPQPDSRHRAIRDIFAQPKAPTCSMVMFLAQTNLHESGKSFVGQDLLPGNFLSLGLIQSIPFSRGHVHISSADPSNAPAIDPRYLSHPLDLDILSRNLLDLERLHQAEPLAPFLKPNGRRNHPDAFLTDLDSAKRYIRDTATTTYHSCGTAAMLPRESGGVVDDRLRVYSTTNVRVVDASVFPLIPAANIMSTVYAVAERAADLIRSDAEE
ncbi:glucose-methanol-choline oxidoreductase [Penicillium canariense]|uniref:Glucose-methanol-choline oxidoreductase n=1 Tax=Penicillium canariense TaxID=189055 RepID=A0A9W9IEL8_9EURO|nr:glucose-methanol-choline oxidoreductase [Penicillium canariense]KAJ5176184.1 glucose-methanol-choline oxidoreductase [Penicillium canariense]